MFKEQTFDAGGVSISYAEGPPSGPPLVMLHGISGWWRSFLSIIPQLSVRWHVYGLDFRGHGRSGRVAKGYQLENYVTDTVAFIQNQVEEPVYLLGHSLGGLVSIGVAAAIPDMVRAIVLEDPPVYGFKGARLKARPFYKLFVEWRDLASTEQSIEEIANQLATLQPDMDATERRFKARSLQLMDPDVLTMYVDGSATESYEMDELLQRVTCPTLFLRGEPVLGGAIEDEDVMHVHSLLPHALFVPIAGVGHIIHPVTPQRYYQVVSKFLESYV